GAPAPTHAAPEASPGGAAGTSGSCWPGSGPPSPPPDPVPVVASCWHGPAEQPAGVAGGSHHRPAPPGQRGVPGRLRGQPAVAGGAAGRPGRAARGGRGRADRPAAPGDRAAGGRGLRGRRARGGGAAVRRRPRGGPGAARGGGDAARGGRRADRRGPPLPRPRGLVPHHPGRRPRPTLAGLLRLLAAGTQVPVTELPGQGPWTFLALQPDPGSAGPEAGGAALALTRVGRAVGPDLSARPGWGARAGGWAV